MLDEYQQKLKEFLYRHASQTCCNDKQLALKEILGDLQIVAKDMGLDFDLALFELDEENNN